MLRQILFALCFACLAWAAEVQLAWDPNTEPDLAGYKIHYGTESGSYSVHVDVGNVTTYLVPGLADGTRYYFAATAYNATLESGYSNEVNWASGEPAPYIGATALRGSKYQAGSQTVTTISDNFDRSDSDSLGANWTEAAGNMIISSNRLRFQSTGWTKDLAVFSGQSLSASQYVLLTVPVSNGGYPGIVLRYTNSSSPYYCITGAPDSDDLYFSYYPSVAGSGTDEATETLSWADGDKLGVTIEGTGSGITVRLWLNPTGNAPDSASSWGGDTTPTFTWTAPSNEIDSGGYVGVTGFAYNATAYALAVDDFYAGDIPTGGGASAVPVFMKSYRARRQ